ncbi:MAG: transposase [Nitrospiraceae bacterium]
MFNHINLEQCVAADHPVRKLRPLIDTDRIRQLCEPLYSEEGHPAIPPEQPVLALLGGYLLGVISERALVRELHGDLVLRWFVGLELDTEPLGHATFSQNRKRRFNTSGLLEQLFDETVARAIKRKLVSHHTTFDGTLLQANASHKSFVPIEVFLTPDAYKKRIRSLAFHGERRSNQTHVSTTDPDAKLANKGNGTAAMVGYTVNGLMENRHRILLGINVETVRGPASETDGGRDVIDAFHEKYAMRIQTVGADKGYFAKPFLAALFKFKRQVTPQVAAKVTGWEAVHQRVRRMSPTLGYHRSQQARKKIEELWGEAKCWHGFRRFRRRGLPQVRVEAYRMGWLLNLKRRSKLMPALA